MRLREAKICLNCDEVFRGAVCPICAACSWRWLQDWIQPLFSAPTREGGYIGSAGGPAAFALDKKEPR